MENQDTTIASEPHDTPNASSTSRLIDRLEEGGGGDGGGGGGGGTWRVRHKFAKTISISSINK